MATTILAVDDSTTMRKILEITFAGTDFDVVVVESGGDALARAQQGNLGLIICDNSLAPDGYDVASQLRSAAPSTPILFLSSRQNPYDASKGQGAGVTDNMDKPFDTQQLIDRATKLAVGGAGAGAAASAPAPAPAATVAPAPAAAVPSKARTMMFGGAVPAPAPAPTPAPAPARAAGFGAGGLGTKPAAPAARPAAPAPVAARPAASAPVAAAMAAGNGQMQAKMAEMGLSPQQADAIMALSRDLVERVVWEVVPVLAETLIKEEIARLTK